MTLNLEIPKEIEAGLLAQANASGLSLDAYIRELLRNAAVVQTGQTDAEMLRREAVTRMQEFGENHNLSLGEPLTRALLHEGHRC
jgi:hypothetical protein